MKDELKKEIAGYQPKNPNYKHDLIECGICGAYHRKGYTGDCRNDAERFSTNELVEKEKGGGG